MSARVAICNLLGVGVSAINMRQAIDTLASWIASGERQYVCVSNVHSLMECQDDAELRRIHNQAGMVTPDGMPLVWLLRRAGHRHASRVYGPDLLLAVFGDPRLAQARHYFYGGAEGVAERLIGRLEADFPRSQIVGSYCPPFRALSPVEDAEAVEQINATRPDIVWVGLGMPKQERWMAAHLGKIHAAALIGVGAAFDFHSGAKRQAPLWMQRSGLEWLFRLASEPRRLWRRYLIYNPCFVYLAILQQLGLRRFALSDEASPAHQRG
jgi:N-acetylglucosaminyldiphosphoundecaprenol N-acetyl-beta-D-mannosaminyltransferase